MARSSRKTPFFAVAAPKPLHAEPPPLIANVFGRETVSLNGAWRSLVDQLGAGDASPLLKGGIGLNRKPADASELLEYGFDGAPELTVPGDWNSQDARLFFYRGVVWYQRDFAYALPPGRRAFLYFGAANYRADVYVNGVRIGEHVGGFTPFNFEITDQLSGPENFVVVKVDNRSDESDVPTENNDWLNYGGLTRDVLLVELPETFIEDYGLELEPGGRSRLAGWLRLNGPDPTQAVTVSLPEIGVSTTVGPDATGFARFSLDAAVELWSPERPRLYAVELACASDRVSDEIGFRTLETRGEDLLLNGEPVFLRGISIHEESVLHPGRAHGREDAEALLGLALELGANFVRLAHYPHDEHTLRAADRMGLLVWSEIPVYQGIDFANPETLSLAKRQLEEVIARDRNRACVILWSVANETRPTPQRNAFLAALADRARQLEPSRLVTAALLGFEGLRAVGEHVAARLAGGDPGPVDIEIRDPLGEIVDVLGYNDYTGWYLPAFLAAAHGLPEADVRRAVLDAMPGFTIRTPFGKPLVISETGAGARQGRHGGDLEVWTEEHQAHVYARQLAMFANAPALRGISPWILKDFRSPLRFLPGIQDYYNRKGLVSDRGVKKRAFSVLRDFYRQRKSREGGGGPQPDLNVP
jgi:beta-glucuronidase